VKSLLRGVCLLWIGFACVGCAPPPRVNFAPPSLGVRLDYRRVHARWTRHAHATHDYATALDAHVTLWSDEFRAAYLDKVSALRQLTSAQRDKLAAELARDGEQWVELVVQLVTSSWTWNELNSPRSVWTLTLIGDDDREVALGEVTMFVGRPETIAALFPPNTPFTRTWRARFPRVLPDGTRLLGPQTRAMTLRIAGALGRAVFRWEAQNLRAASAPSRSSP